MRDGNNTTKLLTIGKVASQANVSIETVRYYERLGLVPEPPRSESGYRLYDEESVKRLRFIKEAQELGFTLEEIRDLLSLRVDANTSCAEVRQRAEQKVTEIAGKIRSLQAMQAALEGMIAACVEGGGPSGACPILETIEAQARQLVRRRE